MPGEALLASMASKKGGQAISGGLSLATGALQGLQAMKLKKKADAAMPELIDPNQAGFLAELAQKRKSIETGADFGAGMNAINSTNAGTNEAITRNTGGDAAGTIQGLLQSQRVANDGINNVIAQGQQQQMQYNSMYGNLLDQISGRKMQLQLLRSQQNRAEWAQMKQAANQNFMAGLGSVLGGKAAPGGAEVTPPATAGAPAPPTALGGMLAGKPASPIPNMDPNQLQGLGSVAKPILSFLGGAL